MSTPIELCFKRYDTTSDYYTLWYRIKNFEPVEINPSGFWKKFIKKVFNKKYFTRNPWRKLYHFCYGGSEKYDYSFHPDELWQNKLISYNEIDLYKNKFKTLEDIEEYINNNLNRKQQMIEKYFRDGHYPDIVY